MYKPTRQTCFVFYLTMFSEKQEEFNMQVVKCDVCLSNKSGSMCTQLSCEHIFCRNCLEEYFSILISEGSVLDLKCPSCSQPIAPNIIKSTITDELFQRFDRLMMERCLEKMDDIHYCPRPSCRTPCILLSKDGKKHIQKTYSKFGKFFDFFSKKTF